MCKGDVKFQKEFMLPFLIIVRSIATIIYNLILKFQPLHQNYGIQQSWTNLFETVRSNYEQHH